MAGAPRRRAAHEPGFDRAPRGLHPAGGRGRRRELDLQLEPALGERRPHIVHEPYEHLVGFLLVLEQRVLLPPGPVLDRRPQLIQVVEVVLPLLVDHAQHDARERLLSETRGPWNLSLDLAQVVELRLERGAPGALYRLHQVGLVLHALGIADDGD